MVHPTKNAIKLITESTFLPISLVSIIIAIAVWVSDLKATAEQSIQDIHRLEQTQKEYLGTVVRIDERLSRIEGKLDAKL
jgi:hypothetical protein